MFDVKTVRRRVRGIILHFFKNKSTNIIEVEKEILFIYYQLIKSNKKKMR